MISKKGLEAMKFDFCGSLKLAHGGQLEFQVKGGPLSTSPGVYLWLHRIDEDRFNVMYAGKAGTGIATRMGQHIGGLRRAPKDRINRIREAFGVGNCLEVWSRKSDYILLDLLFTTKISAYSTEEEALITRFTPPLNRAKPPSTPAVPNLAAEPQADNPAFAALSYELASANGLQRDLWEDALAALTESHRQKIGRVLFSLSRWKVLQDRWPALDFKVIGTYTAGPLRHQSMLVFGELATTNFRKNSMVVYVSLERELIGFSPDVTERMSEPPDVGKAYSLDTCLRLLHPPD